MKVLLNKGAEYSCDGRPVWFNEECFWKQISPSLLSIDCWHISKQITGRDKYHKLERNYFSPIEVVSFTETCWVCWCRSSDHKLVATRTGYMSSPCGTATCEHWPAGRHQYAVLLQSLLDYPPSSAGFSECSSTWWPGSNIFSIHHQSLWKCWDSIFFSSPSLF